MIRPLNPKNLFGLFLLLFLSLPVSSFASVKIGDLYYNLDIKTKTAEVTYEKYPFDNYPNLSGNLIIPSIVKNNSVEYSVIKIGNYAFHGCSSLTSVEIPSSVTSIGDNAFFACVGLTSVEIPNSVIYIGNYSFWFCEGLTSVTIGNSVTSIGKYTFDGCWYLETIYNYALQPQVIDSSVFNRVNINSVTVYVPEESMDLYKTAEVWREFNIIGISESETIENPIKIGDLYYNLYIKTNTAEVTFENKSFNNYPNLSGNLIIPKIIEYNGIEYSVTSIGNQAFYSCNNVTSFEIPNSVINIGKYAFTYCNGLTSIEIPNSVASIGNYAFYNCYNLLAINVEDANQYFKSDSGILYSKDFTTLIQCPRGKQGKVIIPDSVIEIVDNAFYGCHALTSVVIGNSVTSIGGYAFAYSDMLTSVVIGNSVTEIGTHAFEDCSSLTSVEIPNSVSDIGDYAFSSCIGLTKIEIPNSVTEISNYVFCGCSGLTSVEIPNSVTSIGYTAFAQCSSLTSVEIPNSVISIGDYALAGCRNMTSIEIGNSVTSLGEGAFSDCSGLKNVYNYAPQPQSINATVFSGVKINNITLFVPDESLGFYKAADVWKEFNIFGISDTNQFVNPVKIGDLYYNLDIKTKTAEVTYEKYPFDNYPNLSGNLIIPSIVNYKDIEYSVTSIGDHAFTGDFASSGCNDLTSIEIPNSVTSIGDGAFAWCSSLTNIEIPNSVTKIGAGVFNNCLNLLEINVEKNNQNFKSDSGILYNKDFTLLIQCPGGKQGEVIIPDSVIKIGDYAFLACRSLTSVEIPNSVTSLGEWAFSDCKGLTSVEIPNSVTEIGEYAFEWCSGLKTFYNYALQPQAINSFVFASVNTNSVTLYVPDESMDLYKAANVWKEFDIVGIQVGGSDPDPDPEIEFEEKIVNVFYIDKDDYTIHTQTVTLNLPVPEEIDGYTFRKWVVLAGDLDDGIQIQALYVDNDTMKTDSILGDESSDATRKVIRAGKVYILKGDKVYDTNGHEVNRKF